MCCLAISNIYFLALSVKELKKVLTILLTIAVGQRKEGAVLVRLDLRNRCFK